MTKAKAPAERETAGSWKISDSDNCQVVTEGGVLIAQCSRPEDARFIALAPVMGDLCRYMAQDDCLSAEHAFGKAEYVTSKIGLLLEPSA